MINITVMKDEGIIIIEPTGSLEQSDFEKLATEIDAFSEEQGSLTGLIIHTKSFPGWDDFSAFLHHMKFVKEHHKDIKRVAVVTDSKVGAIGPGIAKHFVSAQLKHFEYDNIEEAKKWIHKAT
jgi:hypothetical protein